jgi:hypothetical protein
MPDANALEKYYETLTDDELLNLKSEGGFTSEAAVVLAKELAKRNLLGKQAKRNKLSKRIELHEEVRERGGGYRMPGLQLFGRSYLNDADRKANIQVRTKWFTISYIPLFPIASYRFKCSASSDKWAGANSVQNVINRVPLDWAQVLMTWIKTAVLIGGILLLFIAAALFFVDFEH